jgi:periplasmic protein TonB
VSAIDAFFQTFPAPEWWRRMDSSQRILTVALVISTAAHAGVLAVKFSLPETPRLKPLESPLDVILVNAKHNSKPVKAEALAQANLDGGGEAAKGRAKSFLTKSRAVQDGDKLSEAAARLKQLEEEQKRLLSQLKDSPTRVSAAEAKAEQAQESKPTPQTSGLELMASAQAILRREAEIAKRIEDENARPKRGYVTPSTREVEYAMYFKQWAEKVERVGNVNYPEAARGRTFRLVMTVSVLADGRVEKIEIDRSSGSREVDAAARRIVRLAETFGRFSPAMQARYGVLDLTMTWSFTRGEELSVE